MPHVPSAMPRVVPECDVECDLWNNYTSVHSLNNWIMIWNVWQFFNAAHWMCHWLDIQTKNIHTQTYIFIIIIMMSLHTRVHKWMNSLVDLNIFNHFWTCFFLETYKEISRRSSVTSILYPYYTATDRTLTGNNVYTILLSFTYLYRDPILAQNLPMKVSPFAFLFVNLPRGIRAMSTMERRTMAAMILRAMSSLAAGLSGKEEELSSDTMVYAKECKD